MRNVDAVPWWGWAAVPLTLSLGLLLYPQLPASIPIHYNLAGAPNGFQPRLGEVLSLPALQLALILFWQVLWRIDPRRERYTTFWPTYRYIGGVLPLFLMLVQLWILAHALHIAAATPRLIWTLIGLFFVVVANTLPRVRQNWWVGVRTPWTLSSEAVWQRTQHWSGQTGVALGLLLVVVPWLVPMQTLPALAVGLILTWAAATVLYSYVVFRRQV